MKKSTVIIISFFVLCLGVLLGIWGQTLVISKLYLNNQPPYTKKLNWVIDLIDNKYVDNVSRDSLLDMAVPFILSHLDPHSEYIAPQDLGAVNESIEGKFDGIGVVFNMATDTAIVLNVITGGPGSKAGIQAGDRIIKVNDTIIAGVKINQMDVVGKLRGTRGTKVKLSIARGESTKLIDFTLTRDIIPITSLEADFITRDRSAYVRILNFSENTYLETIDAIDRMVKDGATSVVIDLRGNGGGLLDQALMLANEFLKAEQTIVYFEGAHHPRKEQTANGRGAFQSIPLYVLIDESSASASEIFAGAMQDNDRATIIGRRSFGKGLIQEQVSFADGSAARITIARYYTPLGRPVQKPYSADRDAYEKELIERYNSQELTTGINTHADTTTRYITPAGRELLGGGGISPDIFIAIDTTKLPEYFEKLYVQNIIFPYAQRFSDTHRAKINSIKTIAELESFFATQPNLYEDFISYAASKGVARPTATAKIEAEELIMAQLYAYIGRYTQLQESGFFYYTQPIDHVTLKVSELINKK